MCNHTCRVLSYANVCFRSWHLLSVCLSVVWMKKVLDCVILQQYSCLFYQNTEKNPLLKCAVFMAWLPALLYCSCVQNGFTVEKYDAVLCRFQGWPSVLYVEGLMNRFPAVRRQKYLPRKVRYSRRHPLISTNYSHVGDRGSIVVKLLCYKSEGRWFDPSRCHWIFHWHKIIPIALWSWGPLIL